MKTVSILALFGAVLLLITAIPGIASAEQGKLGIVDIEMVLSESDAGKQANADLAAMAKERQDALNETTAKIDALQKELQGQDKLSEADKKAKQDSLVELTQSYQTELSRVQVELQQAAQQRRNELLQEIGVVLKQIGDEKDYLMIMDAATVFYYKKVVDITWEVIRAFNDYTAQKTQGASPAQPANP